MSDRQLIEQERRERRAADLWTPGVVRVVAQRPPGRAVDDAWWPDSGHRRAVR
ncbi:MAG: hypothetical protein AVDCRST_MAG54-2948 [uncultured Actinomycetospora sp.]|uniref:Uncharacterized protein n=1 Tax=uncultured Actinomycetospora sp. TaxID=1135996 RepID=A0A6J4J710_9PSEU|nr:MAG: hypothetical protein AVDCRST_MAG54-2948 [uncultured Actinomycetospora sp.]